MIKAVLLLCLIFESIIFYAYTKLLFTRTKSFKITLFYYELLYLLVFILHNFNDNVSMLLNIFTFSMANLLILLICYDISLISAIIHSSLISALSLVSEIIVGNICEAFINNYWNEWNNISNLLLMATSCILFGIFVIFCGILQKKLSKHFSFYPDTFMMIIVSVCIIVVITINQFFLLSGEINEVQKSELLVSVLLLALSLFLSIFLFAYMQKLKETHAKDLQQLQLEKDSLSFFEEIKVRDLNQRILLHDIKNHLLSIQELNVQSRNKEIEEYIRNILSSKALSPSIRYCENDLANSIIYRYISEAEKRNIDFEIDSNNPKLSFIQDFHLTTILSNLLDNAIESSSVAPNPFIHLTISTDYDRQISVISIDNACQNKIKFANSIPIGSKKDTINHGLGIKSVMKILEKYDGEIVQFQDDELTFHTVAFLSWRNICE